MKPNSMFDTNIKYRSLYIFSITNLLQLCRYCVICLYIVYCGYFEKSVDIIFVGYLKNCRHLLK